MSKQERKEIDTNVGVILASMPTAAGGDAKVTQAIAALLAQFLKDVNRMAQPEDDE